MTGPLLTARELDQPGREECPKCGGALVRSDNRLICPRRSRGPDGMTDPWLDKRGIAEYFSCSVRSIEQALTGGMPHARIFGRVKFQVAEVEPWLAQNGHLQRRGGTLPVPEHKETHGDA